MKTTLQLYILETGELKEMLIHIKNLVITPGMPKMIETHTKNLTITQGMPKMIDKLKI